MANPDKANTMSVERANQDVENMVAWMQDTILATRLEA
jgi:hypothetical protein